MVSIFVRLAKQIYTPFKEFNEASIKSHNIDVISIVKYFEIFPKEFTDFFSTLKTILEWEEVHVFPCILIMN